MACDAILKRALLPYPVRLDNNFLYLTKSSSQYREIYLPCFDVVAPQMPEERLADQRIYMVLCVERARAKPRAAKLWEQLGWMERRDRIACPYAQRHTDVGIVHAAQFLASAFSETVCSVGTLLMTNRCFPALVVSNSPATN